MSELAPPTLIISNPKNHELSVTGAPAWDALGIPRYHINPAKGHQDIIPNTNLNFLAHLLDAYNSSFKTHRLSVVPQCNKVLLMMFPDPMNGESSAQFFARGTRKIAEVVTLWDIVNQRIPYPGRIWKIVSDPDLCMSVIRKAAACKPDNKKVNRIDTLYDPVAEHMQKRAKGLLAMKQTRSLERYVTEFMSQAEDQTNIYTTASLLGDYGENGIPLTILRRQSCILTVDVPLAYMNVWQNFVGAIFRSIIEMGKLTPGRCLHFLFEEAANANLSGIEDDLTVIRGLNMKADFMFQYPGQFGKATTPDDEEALISQASTVGYSAIRGKGAQFLSERLGKATETISSGTMGAEKSTNAGASFSRKAKPFMTPQEVENHGLDRQIYVISNAKGDNGSRLLFDLYKPKFWEIKPHKDIMGFNPVENKSPPDVETLMEMEYQPGQEPVSLDSADPDDFDDNETWTVHDEGLFTPASFFWVLPFIAIEALLRLYTEFSLFGFLPL